MVRGASGADRLTKPDKLTIRAVSFKDACAFVAKHHRHHKPPQGHKFSMGAFMVQPLIDETPVGVAVVGRPVARKLDNGERVEVTRLCTDGTFNACSFLYGACARAAKALGYRHILTYILESEQGASLRAAGWNREADSPGRSWSCPSRPRDDIPLGPKVRYGKPLND